MAPFLVDSGERETLVIVSLRRVFCLLYINSNLCHAFRVSNDENVKINYSSFVAAWLFSVHNGVCLGGNSIFVCSVGVVAQFCTLRAGSCGGRHQ